MVRRSWGWLKAAWRRWNLMVLDDGMGELEWVEMKLKVSEKGCQ